MPLIDELYFTGSWFELLNICKYYFNNCPFIISVEAFQGKGLNKFVVAFGSSQINLLSQVFFFLAKVFFVIEQF